jgi:fucose permease
VLALIGWVVQTLPLIGTIAAVMMIAAVVIALWMAVRKRQSRGSSSE